MERFFLQKTDKEIKDTAAGVFKELYGIDPPNIGDFSIPKEVIKAYQDTVRNETEKYSSGPRGSDEELSADADSAMLNKGGIDFKSDKVDSAFAVKNSGGEIKFHIDPAMLQQLQNAPGFVPVIINIQPMTDLRLFLGLNQEAPVQSGHV